MTIPNDGFADGGEPYTASELQFMSTPTAVKTKNPHRVPLSIVAADNGYDSTAELLEGMGQDSVMPACCDEECQVEPDGRCEHGCPSILLAAGMI